MFKSLRNLPVEAPLSATDTTAVISTGNNFNPFNICDNPEPPPNIIIFFILFTLHKYMTK